MVKGEPIRQKPYRLSKEKLDALPNILKGFEEQGIIQDSTAEWAQPIVMVPKPNGTWRMCVDFRQLNERLIGDAYPLPNIDEIIMQVTMSEAQYFTVMDLKNAFHLLELTPESRKYTSFVTPIGQKEYTRLPYGLKNAPSIFQRTITNILLPFINQTPKNTIVYIDDGFLFTKDKEIHLTIFKEIITELQKYNVSVNWTKSTICQQHFTYLGYVFTPTKISMKESQVKCILDSLPPQDVQQLQRVSRITSIL